MFARYISVCDLLCTFRLTAASGAATFMTSKVIDMVSPSYNSTTGTLVHTIGIWCPPADLSERLKWCPVPHGDNGICLTSFRGHGSNTCATVHDDVHLSTICAGSLIENMINLVLDLTLEAFVLSSIFDTSVMLKISCTLWHSRRHKNCPPPRQLHSGLHWRSINPSLWRSCTRWTRSDNNGVTVFRGGTLCT